MTKRSHKLRSMGDVQSVVSRSATLAEAAKTLGVDRSTLTRWLQAGKVQRGRQHPAPDTPAARDIPVPPNPVSWAETVRTTYVLTDTDKKLVDLAERMLTLAEADGDGSPLVKITATGRFQQIVKQLNLIDDKRVDAAPKDAKPARPTVARSGGVDPRAVLMAVK